MRSLRVEPNPGGQTTIILRRDTGWVDEITLTDKERKILIRFLQNQPATYVCEYRNAEPQPHQT